MSTIKTHYMLFTTATLKTIPKGKEFARGQMVIESGDLVYWIARKGQVEDWAIYYSGHASFSDNDRNGIKVTDRELIKRLIPCTDALLNKYRR